MDVRNQTIWTCCDLLMISLGIVFPLSRISSRACWVKVQYPSSSVPAAFLQCNLLAISGEQVNCSSIEFVDITPPSGQTCGQYMDTYISLSGGYLTNPDATADCHFCSVRTTDEYLASSFNIFYSHRWRNVGFMIAFIMCNVCSFFHSTVYLYG